MAKRINGPRLWDDILRVVTESYNVPAVIAGGCVRDNVMGFAPKDIDVFVPIPDELNLELSKPEGFRLFEPSTVKRTKLTTFGEAYGAASYKLRRENGEDIGDPTINAVVEGKLFEYDVQVIAKTIPGGFSSENLIKTFDYGLVKAYYDPNVGIVTSDEFKHDLENNICTISDFITSEQNKARTMNRIANFQRRNNWNYTAPPSNGPDGWNFPENGLYFGHRPADLPAGTYVWLEDSKKRLYALARSASTWSWARATAYKIAEDQTCQTNVTQEDADKVQRMLNDFRAKNNTGQKPGKVKKFVSNIWAPAPEMPMRVEF